MIMLNVFFVCRESKVSFQLGTKYDMVITTTTTTTTVLDDDNNEHNGFFGLDLISISTPYHIYLFVSFALKSVNFFSFFFRKRQDFFFRPKKKKKFRLSLHKFSGTRFFLLLLECVCV